MQSRSPSARFGQRFGGRKSEVQAERRRERSRNVTTAAVPLTEAQRDCVLLFPSATSAREAAAQRALVADSSKSRHLKIIQNNQNENSFCVIIAQTPAAFSVKLDG
jgi:hypothetical protein